MTAARLQRALHHLDDAELISLVRGGDRHALGELFRRHAPAARRAARAFTGSADDADDVVSDVFASIWSALRNGNGPRDRFEPYMITAIKHRARTAWAKQAPVTGVDPVPATAAAADTRDDHDLATSAFRCLSPREREMLWLTAVEGRSSVDAGAEMSLTRRAAATLKFRATRSFAEAYLSAYAAAVARPECQELSPKLSSFVRGSCRPRARRNVEQHLAVCPECHRLTDRLADVNETLRSIPQPILAGLVATAQAKGAWTSSVAGSVRRGWLKPVVYSAAAGAVTLIPTAAMFGTDRDVPQPEAIVVDVEPPDPGERFDKRQRVRMQPATFEQDPAALASGATAPPPDRDDDPAASTASTATTGRSAAPAGPGTGSSGSAVNTPAAVPTGEGDSAAAPAADAPMTTSVTTTVPPASTQPDTTAPATTAPATTAPDARLVELEVTLPPVIEAGAGVDAELSGDDAGVELEVDATVPLLGTEIGVDLDLDLTGGDDDEDDEALLELDLLD